MSVRGRVRFKAEDIWDAPEDTNRYEVIDGDLYVSPAPSWLHQRGLGVLFYYLMQYIRPRRLGELVQAPVGEVLDDETGVQPDLVYVSRERAGIITERGIEGAPDLVVEAVSPSTEARDRGLKMRRYAAAGIPHCWLLVPRDQALEACRLGEQGYEQTGVYGPGSIFRSELFPGLEIPIDDLWA
jgi:Uma2 family endonuclease